MCSYINVCMTQLHLASATELGQQQADRLVSRCPLWLTVSPSQQEGNYIYCHPAESGKYSLGV